MTLQAGTARIELTPADAVPLMGYGARNGPSEGVHDRLWARALSLAETGRESRGVLLLSADLCLITTGQAVRIRQQIARATGLPAGNILVACTHTHSGPETGLSASARGKPLPEHVPKLIDAIVKAGCKAHEAAGSARAYWVRTESWIGRNRQRRDGPLDPEVRALHVRGPHTRAVLFHHGCHPTVLGHENRLISADWPGAAMRRIERNTAGFSLFLLGAHADVDPRTRGLKDLAIPNQSVGLGFEAVEVLGSEIAQAVLVAGPQGAGSIERIEAASTRVSLALRLAELSDAQAEEKFALARQTIAQLLEIKLDDLPRTSRLETLARTRLRNRPVEEVREVIARIRAYVRDKTAPYFVGGARRLDIDLQVLRIGEVALLALPAEATVEVGLDWKRRTQAHGMEGAVVSIANGWLRYLPHARDIAHPGSHRFYEVLSNVLAPESCEQLLDAGERLLAQRRS